MTRQAGGGGNAKMMNFGKSRARMISGDANKVTFKDVAGIRYIKSIPASISKCNCKCTCWDFCILTYNNICNPAAL